MNSDLLRSIYQLNIVAISAAAIYPILNTMVPRNSLENHAIVLISGCFVTSSLLMVAGWLFPDATDEASSE